MSREERTFHIVFITLLCYTPLMAEDTLQKIHQVAVQEFLERGFRGASLREIVKKAGVTTGAFYGYYKSKEELFRALVKPHADYLFSVFEKYLNDFSALSKEKWAKNMTRYSDEGFREMYDYAFDHRDAFRLILRSSEGTEFEDYIHRIVEKEIAITHTFYEVIQSQGYHPHALNPMLEHIIVSGIFSSFFELIIHDISKEEGLKCVKELHDFYAAGWESVLKVKN